MAESCELSKVTSAYLKIKELVIGCRIQPGQHLQINDLSNWLHLSVTPVREALMRLAAERLIDCFPNRGYFARKLDVGEHRILHEAADVILFHALGHSLPWPDLGEPAAHGVACKLERLYEVIVSCSGNAELLHFIRNYNERTHFIRRLYVAGHEEAVSADSWKIIEALKAFRPAEAVTVLGEHRADFGGALPELLKQALAETLLAPTLPMQPALCQAS